MEFKIKDTIVTEKFTIPDYKIDRFMRGFKSLEAKLKKFKLETPTYTISEPFDYKWTDDEGQERTQTRYTISVTAPSLSIENFTLLATISRKNKGLPELHYHSPEFKIEHIESHPEKMECAKCKTVRHRVHFSIIRDNSSQKIFTVGKECAEDFFDKNTVRRYLALNWFHELKILEDDDINVSSLRDIPAYYPTDSILAHAIDVYKAHGFSAKSNKENSSIDRTIESFLKTKPTSESLSLAREFILNPASLTMMNNEGLKYKIKASISNSVIHEKELAFLVLIPGLIFSGIENEKKLQKNKEEDKGFYGAIEENVILHLTITDKRARPSQFHKGDDYTVYATSDQGHLFTIPGANFYPDIGERIEVNATIKKHYSYMNKSFTHLVRVKTVKCKDVEAFVYEFVELFNNRKLKSKEDDDKVFFDYQGLCEKYNLIPPSEVIFLNISNLAGQSGIYKKYTFKSRKTWAIFRFGDRIDLKVNQVGERVAVIKAAVRPGNDDY